MGLGELVGLVVVEANDQINLVEPGVDETEVGPKRGIVRETEESHRRPIRCNCGFTDGGDSLSVAAVMGDGGSPCDGGDGL